MNEQYAIRFDAESRLTIATCLGCGTSIELDYSSEHAHETSDRAIQWGRVHAWCVPQVPVTAEEPVP